MDFLEYLSSGGDFGRKILEPGLYGSEVSHNDSVVILTLTYSQSGADFGVKQDNFRNWTSWLRGEPLWLSFYLHTLRAGEILA